MCNVNDIISLELLRLVLEDDSIDFIDRELRSGENIGYFSNRDRKKEYVDIHRVAHKCKEWAYRNKYVINSSLTFRIDGSNEIAQSQIFKTGQFGCEFFNGETEPEAIFKACQWILDNKDK